MRASVKAIAPSRLSWLDAVWIPVLYASALLVVSPIHSTFNEWGGVMQYFAGQEMLAGAGYTGWASRFWPPLFSLSIGLGSLLLPGFVAGKAISILAGALLLYVSYHLAIDLTRPRRIGLWTQVFLALSPIFVFQSLQAHNHMLDALLFVTGLWLYLKALQRPTAGKLLAVGIACGLAGLTRYTSYVLLALPLFLFLAPGGLSVRNGAKLAVAFWIGFSVVSLPWWYANAVSYGSPLSTWEHLNVCTAVAPGAAAGSLTSLWRCAGQAQLDSILSIIFAYPVRYAEHLVRNGPSVASLLIRYGGVLAPFVIPAFFESPFSLPRNAWLIVLGQLLLYVLLVSQAFVAEWFLLSWMALIVLLSVVFLLKYLVRLQEEHAALARLHFQSLVLALLIAGGLALTARSLLVYAGERESSAALADLDKVTQALKEHDPDLGSKTLMAVDPGRAYYAGTKYLATPLLYQGPVVGMVSYSGLSELERAYAPKYPANTPVSQLRADYLVYTKPPPVWSEPQDLPQYEYLLDPATEEIPSNFRVVYRSAQVAVYEIDWPSASSADGTGS